METLFSSKKAKNNREEQIELSVTQAQELPWRKSEIPPDKIIKRSDLTLSDSGKLDIVDKGNFGQIFKGTYNGDIVAVKTISLSSNINDNIYAYSEFITKIETFVEECEISLLSGRHRHVFDNHLGVYFPEKMPEYKSEKTISPLDMPCLVSKFMPKGNMLKYLADPKLENFKVNDAINYCLQLANGMIYLQHNKINHADLACRNLLLDSNLTLKIADFGLSQKGVEYNYGFAVGEEERKAHIPENWAAMEVIEKKKITNFSDVWSFGVTAWEIFTRGLQPYLKLDELSQDYRLKRPKTCPLAVFMLFIRCWHKDPKKRPDFEIIEQALRKFINTPDRFGIIAGYRINNLHEKIERPSRTDPHRVLHHKKTAVYFTDQYVSQFLLNDVYLRGNNKHQTLPFDENNCDYTIFIQVDQDKNDVDYYIFFNHRSSKKNVRRPSQHDQVRTFRENPVTRVNQPTHGFTQGRAISNSSADTIVENCRNWASGFDDRNENNRSRQCCRCFSRLFCLKSMISCPVFHYRSTIIVMYTHKANFKGGHFLMILYIPGCTRFK